MHHICEDEHVGDGRSRVVHEDAHKHAQVETRVDQQFPVILFNEAVPELQRSNDGLHGHLWEAHFPKRRVENQQTVRLVAEQGEECDQH